MGYWPHPDDVLVTPDQLCAFAWSAPMRDLAAKVGMSDVGLKKMLRSHGIVPPPQGYWNKVHAGKPVPERPQAGPRRPGESGRIRLDARFADVLVSTPPMPVDGPFASALVPEALEDLREQELKALGRIGMPRDLKRPHPALTHLLKGEERRREKANGSPYAWDAPAYDNPLGQRRLRLLNAIFHALEKRGHRGDVHDDHGELHARAIIGSTYLSIAIDIVGKYPTAVIRGYYRPVPTLPASTFLKLSVDPSFQGQAAASWRDDEDGKLESKIAAIAAGIIVVGEAAFRRGLREAVERAERQRQLEEKARQERLAALEAKRLENLRQSGELLRQAEDIRALVARVKGAVLAGQDMVEPHELVAWEAWALDYADRLDPVKSGQILTHLKASQR